MRLGSDTRKILLGAVGLPLFPLFIIGLILWVVGDIVLALHNWWRNR